MLSAHEGIEEHDAEHQEAQHRRREHQGRGAEHGDELQYQEAWDDIRGQNLDPKAVTAARFREMKYIRKKDVWKFVTREEARNNGWKIIKTRCIDVNKGDDENPNYRSRLVAKEFNDGGSGGIVREHPPWEALRMLVREASTVRSKEEWKSKLIMVNDVARAFFEAPIARSVCVELPVEAEAPGGTVGLLKMSFHGTRDAAANFQAEFKMSVQVIGFVQSRYNQSLYYCARRYIRTLVHVDDLISIGPREQAVWLPNMLEGRFEIKTKTIRLDPEEQTEARVLNRIVRVTTSGWEYELDQRQAEIIIQAMNLDGAKGTKETDSNDQTLPLADATQFRAIAVRANYLALDRADIQYCTREIC